MARRRNSCEDCTTSVSHCCGTCLQYTLHTPHPPHHSPTQHSIAQLTTPHRQQASIPLSMSTMRRCAKCKSSLGLGQHEGKRRKNCDTHTQTFAHTHTHSLRSCSAWAATFTWRILKRVTAIKAPESAYAHHAHSPPAKKQNKTKPIRQSKMIKSQLPRSRSAACTSHSKRYKCALSACRSLLLLLYLSLSLSLTLSRCGHSVINIYHISTLWCFKMHLKSISLHRLSLHSLALPLSLAHYVCVCVCACVCVGVKPPKQAQTTTPRPQLENRLRCCCAAAVAACACILSKADRHVDRAFLFWCAACKLTATKRRKKGYALCRERKCDKKEDIKIN